MAKQLKRKRPSAPIPEDLPPVFAPKNGRITLQARQEEEYQEQMRQVVLYAQKARTAGPGVPVNEITWEGPGDPPPRAPVVYDDGTRGYVDTATYGAGGTLITGANVYAPTASTMFTYRNYGGTGGNTGITATGIVDGGMFLDQGTVGTPVSVYGNTVIASNSAATMLTQPVGGTGMNVGQNLIHITSALPTTAANFTVNYNTQGTLIVNVTGVVTATTGTANTVNIITGGTGATTVNGDGWHHGTDWIVGHARKVRDACCDSDWKQADWGARTNRRSDVREAYKVLQDFTDKARQWKQWNATLQTSKESRKQREAREANQAEQARIAEERRRLEQAEYEVRRARAEKLLHAVLNPQQRDEYQKTGMFHLYTQSGKKYRIKKGSQHGNVYLINEKGEESVSYCIQPQGGLPDADAHVAQKLLLETDEPAFLRIANASPLRR